MKRILGVVFGALLMMVTSHGAWAFGVKDVIAMHERGVADSLVVQKIVYSGVRFHLDAKDIDALKKAGVSDAVISKMLKTENRGHYAGSYWGSDWGPYYPYYGPYYGPYYPHYYYRPYYSRVYVGLRFGHYGGGRVGFRHWR